MIPNTIKGLRELCVKYSLPVYGAKKVIKARLIEYLKTIGEEDEDQGSDKDATEEQEEPARNGEDEQDILPKFSGMKKDELIAECRRKKLAIRGNKDALVKRLAEYQVFIIIISIIITSISRPIFGNNKSRERSSEIQH